MYYGTHEKHIKVQGRGELNCGYFSKFFSKIMKKPFFEFLKGYKINKACKLLIETDKRVSEIFYTLSSF